LEGFLLNEQTWLQHLKEKRLAYGLSQNRLAVATGITRQYLSDIETGKVKPSEDLQAVPLGSSGTLQSRRSP
jgi:phage replication initiation protein